MSKDLNSEGLLILENLNPEERKELISSICNFIAAGRRAWDAEFQAFHLDTSDLDEADAEYVEGMSRMTSADPSLVWTQVNDTFHDFTQAVYPVENLGPVYISGEMIVPGFQTEESGVRSEVVGYHLAKKSWSENLDDSSYLMFMASHTPADEKLSFQSSTPYVWVWTEFDCPFCLEGLECTGDEDFTSGSIEHRGGSITFDV